MSNFCYSSRSGFDDTGINSLVLGVPRAFGDMVEALCKARGWSLRDLASRYDRRANQDTAVSHLSKIVSAKIAPRPRVIEQLADALRLDGAERERFILMGMLAKAPEPIEIKYLDLERRVLRLESR